MRRTRLKPIATKERMDRAISSVESNINQEQKLLDALKKTRKKIYG